jgi:hypothetical protein
MRRVASTPPQRGMFRSISTTWGPGGGDRLDRGHAVLGLAGHGDPGQRAEQQDQALAHGGLVIGDDRATGSGFSVMPGSSG